MRYPLLVIFGVSLLALAGCGETKEQRAATGGVAGLVVAGPVGAVVGAGLGVVTHRN
ncbi:hypothetical protein [Thioclava sp. F1Mire-8]|uniref:hypothetical protein n=1 Tax=Thioclava sp. F1Mire-8 TaxID=1973006 RepID=UPI00143AAF20|nr:hypothetical protein [Thioclava sp. F1Mire-8]